MIFGHLLLEKDVPIDDDNFKLEEDEEQKETEKDKSAKEVEIDEDDDYSLPDDDESEDDESEENSKTVPTEDSEDYSLPDDNTDEESESGDNNIEQDPTPEDNTPTDDDYSLDDSEEDSQTDDDSEEDDQTDDSEEDDQTDDSEEDSQTDDSEEDSLNSNTLKDLEDKLYKNMTTKQINIKHKELKKNFLNLYNNIEVILSRVDEINKTTSNIHILNFIQSKLEETKNYIYNYLSNVYHTNTYIENNNQYLIFVSILNNINLLFTKMNTKKDN